MKTLSKGFTLIELLVVIAIIGILSSIVLTSLQSSRDRAYNAKLNQEFSQIKLALESYNADHDGYPICPLGYETCCIGTGCVYDGNDIDQSLDAITVGLEDNTSNLAATITFNANYGNYRTITVDGKEYKGFVYTNCDNPEDGTCKASTPENTPFLTFVNTEALATYDVGTYERREENGGGDEPVGSCTGTINNLCQSGDYNSCTSNNMCVWSGSGPSCMGSDFQLSCNGMDEYSCNNTSGCSPQYEYNSGTDNYDFSYCDGSYTISCYNLSSSECNNYPSNCSLSNPTDGSCYAENASCSQFETQSSCDLYANEGCSWQQN